MLEKTEQKPQPNSDIQCILCGSKKSQFLFLKRGHQIFQCSSCSLLFVYPQPNPEHLKKYYDEQSYRRGNKYEYTFKNDEIHYGQKINDQRRVAFIQKYIPHGSLLDVGCANGLFIYQARDNYEVSGVELSKTTSADARSLGLDVIEGEIADIPRDKKFDIVTGWDIIEHVRQPITFAQDLNRLLKVGGYAFLETGNADSFLPRLSLKNWSLMTPPDHLHYFSKKTITKLLETQGFEIIDTVTRGKVMSLEWLSFKIADTYGLKPLKWVHSFIKNTPLKKVRLPINTFDIMTVVARKVRDLSE